MPFFSFPISPSIMEPKQKVSFFRHEKEEYTTKQRGKNSKGIRNKDLMS
jgi:hypothetical protein